MSQFVYRPVVPCPCCHPPVSQLMVEVEGRVQTEEEDREKEEEDAAVLPWWSHHWVVMLAHSLLHNLL